MPPRPAAILSLLLLHATCALAAGSEVERGREVYEAHCHACHSPGNVMVSSPKAGDVPAWEARLAKGVEKATDNAMGGIGAMPPKGGAEALTRDEVRAAIRFMASGFLQR